MYIGKFYLLPYLRDTKQLYTKTQIFSLHVQCNIFVDFSYIIKVCTEISIIINYKHNFISLHVR